MKKVFALVLTLALLLSATAVFAEKTQITLWSIAVESDANTPAYKAAINAFNTFVNIPYEAGEGYELVMEPTENELYKTKIKAAMSDGNNLPDIFFTWSMSFLGDFVDAGRVYCLDDALPAYKDELTDSMLANTTYDGKHYGVPMTMNVVTLFANMELLAKAGWDKAPETYDELIKCCDDLKAAGIIPFGVAGKEQWCLSEYVEPILVKTIGAEGLKEVYQTGKWNNEGVVKAMQLFYDMVDKEYFDPAAPALTNEEAKQNFLAGKTAFYQNGSWNCGEVAAAGENFVAIPFPVIDAEKSTLYQMVGGPNDTLAVAATAKNPEMTARLAFELGKTISREGNLIGSGLPCWAVNYDASKVNRVSQTVASWVANNEPLVLFGDNILPANEAQIYLDYISQIYAKQITAEQFAEGLESEMLALK